MSLLEHIGGTADIRKLSFPQLEELCAEIRQELIKNVSVTGGHLASNLGIVELTVALHNVYDPMKDRIVFDVGHQSYVHKMLTGRLGQFPTLRQEGGLSGFPKPEESVADAFIAGHASNSVSVALGMARARTLTGGDYDVVALMGDGALTGGLAFEGLNNAGQSREPMVIILNDNGIAINHTVGGMAKYLTRQRVKPAYYRLKRAYRKVLLKTKAGAKVFEVTQRWKNKLKAAIFSCTAFEEMGFRYMGPVDGHNVRQLSYMLNVARNYREPVLLHVVTQKGKGYPYAEQDPSLYHSVGPFAPEKGAKRMEKSCFSSVFGEEITNLALKDDLEAIELGVRRKPQFAARDAAREANVRMLYNRSELHLSSPFSWTVTNVWAKEVLTYAGKKSSAELEYAFNPSCSSREILSATVSNRDGRVYCVTPKEMNLLDADWVASAPRYPASKKLVVNLPAVEIGSVIRVTSVTVVTNSPVAYCNIFTFDSTEPIGVKELLIAGVPMKVMTSDALGTVTETDRFEFAVTNPAALPREGNQPPALLWRKSALVSAADLDGWRESLFAALADARARGSDATTAIARRLVEGIDSPEARIRAVRDWLWKNVRVAGPGLFTLPLDQAFFPPDRSLSDGYASGTDWMNIYFTMLEAIGCETEYLLSDDDAAGYPAIARARRDVPQPDDFNDLLIRATVREGGWMFGLFGGTERTFILDYENEFTPLGVRDVEGRNGRSVNYMSFEVNVTGSARITVSNSTWGVAVAALRKRYSEMLPEMRARHHTELIGNIAESAEAISGLETDVDGYPFVISYSAYAPNYAAKNGDSLTLVVPGLGGTFMPGGESERKSPFGVGGRLRPSVYIREVVFPEGYTEVEHLPEPWAIVFPGESAPRSRATVESRIEDGRLHVTFIEEHLPCTSAMFTKDWLGFFRDWNRRTGSRLIRTIVVRKGKR